MKRGKVAAIAAIAASGLVGLGLALTGTAHAGLNGQQIRVCAANGDYQQVRITGVNQDGEPRTVTNAFGRGCLPIADFWWVGDVTITLEQSTSGAAPRSALCNVPKEILTHSFVDCRVDEPATAAASASPLQ